jgi:hypothetical protein
MVHRQITSILRRLWCHIARQNLENSLLSFTRIVLSSTQVQYEEDDLDAYNDPFGLARELIKTKIIGREKAIAELERNCSAMFGTI